MLVTVLQSEIVQLQGYHATSTDYDCYSYYFSNTTHRRPVNRGGFRWALVEILFPEQDPIALVEYSGFDKSQ